MAVRLRPVAPIIYPGGAIGRRTLLRRELLKVQILPGAPRYGGLAEWSIASVLKTEGRKRSVSSNLTSSSNTVRSSVEEFWSSKPAVGSSNLSGPANIAVDTVS